MKLLDAADMEDEMREEPFLEKIIIAAGIILILGAFFAHLGRGDWSPTVSALTGIGILLGIVCGHLWRIIVQLSEISAAVGKLKSGPLD